MNNWPTFRMAKKRPDRVYIRFGRWSSRSYNHATGERERGVSVYRAELHDDGSVSLAETVPGKILNGRVCFVVTGKEVGIGSDGEPLLQQVVARPYAIRLAEIPVDFRKRVA